MEKKKRNLKKAQRLIGVGYWDEISSVFIQLLLIEKRPLRLSSSFYIHKPLKVQNKHIEIQCYLQDRAGT